MVNLPFRFSGSAKVREDKTNPISGPTVLAADAMPVFKEWYSLAQVNQSGYASAIVLNCFPKQLCSSVNILPF